MSAVFSGIECPKCHSIDLKVLETRRQQKAIVRRRECDRRHTFSTVELLADDDGMPSTTPDDAEGLIAVAWRFRLKSEPNFGWIVTDREPPAVTHQHYEVQPLYCAAGVKEVLK